jgi:6-pyruvoyl-tetrahydropterin synthase related domain
MISRSLHLPASRSFDFGLRPERKHLIILVLVAGATLAPTLFWGIPSNHDLSNHFRFELPFYDALRAGHLYPGWLSESNHGFGDASFRFYPPALYYLLALAKTIAGSWYAATVITFTTLSILGALGVYLWAREFGSSQIAMLAGILYSLAPYRLNQFFQATLLAEFAGAAVLPFAFAFTLRVCRHGGKKNIAGLAASYALLVLTHLPLAVIGSIALGIYALLCIGNEKRARTLGRLALSAGIGLAASAGYWTTMLAELNWIRADNINPDPSVDYRKNFVLSTFSPDYLSVWWMNILLLAMFAMFWPALVLLFKKAEPSEAAQAINRRSTRALAILLLFTFFMATPLSQPIWRIVHPLQQTQFPWRWLSITSMVCSLLLAMAIPLWTRYSKGPRRPLLVIALGTVLMSLAFSAFHIVREATWLSPPEFEQTISNIPGSTGVTQWLPVWVHEPLPTMTARVDAPNRAITIKRWEPQQRVFHVEAGGATEARVQTFFYPHWKATAGGRNLTVHPDHDGTLVVALPSEATDVYLEFREPNRSRYASGLSLLGWGLIGGLSLRRKRSSSK